MTATVVLPTPPFPLATAMTGTCSMLSGMSPPWAGEAKDLLKKSVQDFLLAQGALYRLYIVLPLSLRRAALTAVAAAAAYASVAGFAAPAADAAGVPHSHVSSALISPAPQATGSGAAATQAAPDKQTLIPDPIAAVPGGITSTQVAKIRKLGGVQAVLPVDGGKVMVNGRSANVLGVSAQTFRPWTPLSTATSAAIWSDLGQGKLISTSAAARRLHLAAG